MSVRHSNNPSEAFIEYQAVGKSPFPRRVKVLTAAINLRQPHKILHPTEDTASFTSLHCGVAQGFVGYRGHVVFSGSRSRREISPSKSPTSPNRRLRPKSQTCKEHASRRSFCLVPRHCHYDQGANVLLSRRIGSTSRHPMSLSFPRRRDKRMLRL